MQPPAAALDRIERGGTGSRLTFDSGYDVRLSE